LNDFVKHFEDSYNLDNPYIIVQRNNMPGLIDHHNHVKVKNKIAVMVNGHIPNFSATKTPAVMETIWNIKVNFKNCDIYWQTWDTPEQREIVKKFQIHHITNVKFVPLPDSVNINSNISQRISFAKQWERIPKLYDYYVKTRWDLYSGACDSSLINNDIMKLAKDRVVGIGLQANKGDKRTTRKIINSGHYCVIDSMVSEGIVCDDCIIFKKSDMDGVSTDQPINKDEWHEILCQKRDYVNIDGIFALWEHVENI